MNKVNVIFFIGLATAVTLWTIFSGTGGYTSRTAMIMARSMSIESTIAGRVVDISPSVGATIAAGTLLATVRDDRIDRGRLVELQSLQEFLSTEVGNARRENEALSARSQRFKAQADSYRSWTVEDLYLSRTQIQHELNSAAENYAQKSAEIERVKALHKKAHVSDAVLSDATSNAVIAHNQREALRVQMTRIDLRIKSAESGGALREDGGTSYWDQSIGEIETRLLENRRQISTMRAQLIQTTSQIVVERDRLARNTTEELRAPFDGIVNAVFASPGENVVIGAVLMEVLDCSRPIAIVPVPESRFSEFSVGQKAIVQPIGSDQTMVGTIQHKSSGPLIGRDTTIAANPDFVLDGNKLIISLENNLADATSGNSCNTARRAIVTIQTNSIFEKISDLVGVYFGAEESDVKVAKVQ